MSIDAVQAVLDYLKEHELLLTTAESCTAGRMVALLSEIPGSGEVLESGYVVYSPTAKQRLLRVSADTIEQFGLTSVQVAREMAVGALQDSPANVAVATTGVAGPEPQGDIKPGTLCFAWAFAGEPIAVFTRTLHFDGDREAVMHKSSLHGLEQVRNFHQRWLRGERA
ncbi:CinA family protein [Pseudomonas capeferrum]|uniref:CinA family protein n=1 Tax=Pseudomonas capeferrum TaxID=1495066 RepID=UPI0015E43190|nr:CinA family protein [Pseudomonas capeferrum]MBA1204131.1 CinA family protein [Pseudomonas capeferrum]